MEATREHPSCPYIEVQSICDGPKNHTMAQHLRVISAMIREMKAASNDLTDEQQILVVIRCLFDPSWEDVKLVLTHNEGIKTFDDISQHLELEAST